MAFLNLQRLLDANKDKGEEMASRALGTEQAAFGAANKAIADVSAGNIKADDAQAPVADAAAKMKALRSMGGMGQAVGGNAFDAALAGKSNTFGNAYAQMGQFQQRLGQAQQERETIDSAMADRRQKLQAFKEMQESIAPAAKPEDRNVVKAKMDSLYQQMTDAYKFGDRDAYQRAKAQWEQLAIQYRNQGGR